MIGIKMAVVWIVTLFLFVGMISSIVYINMIKIDWDKDCHDRYGVLVKTVDRGFVCIKRDILIEGYKK